MSRTFLIFKRLLSTDVIVSKSPSITPIKMSYTSYENTASVGSLPAPVVIMHGLFGSKGNWNSLCKAMHNHTNPTRKIIAVDARNHGDSPHTRDHDYKSMAYDIRTLLETQRLEKVNLLGHSMGGRAMMMFAMKWPEYVEKLIVVDISPVSNSGGMHKMREYFDVMQELVLENRLPLSTARALADSQLARLIPDKGVRAFLLTNLVQKPNGSFAWRMNVPVLKANYDKISQFSEFVQGMKFQGPTLFLAGSVSDYIQKKDHKAIKEMFPNAQFHTIEGAGHWLHSEKPHEFLQSVVNFLNIN